MSWTICLDRGSISKVWYPENGRLYPTEMSSHNGIRMLHNYFQNVMLSEKYGPSVQCATVQVICTNLNINEVSKHAIIKMKIAVLIIKHLHIRCKKVSSEALKLQHFWLIQSGQISLLIVSVVLQMCQCSDRFIRLIIKDSCCAEPSRQNLHIIIFNYAPSAKAIYAELNSRELLRTRCT